VLTLSLPLACPFSAFTVPLYLAFRGGWPDLTYGISGVWALSPKLLFQLYHIVTQIPALMSVSLRVCILL
jgi:hypothetical protein